MNRRVLIAVCAVVAIAVFLSLRAIFLAVFPVETPTQLTAVDNSVVAMADGSVMIARPGTISRDVINWFNDKSAAPKQFDIGRQPFVPNSDLAAPEAEVRLARFATELKANPDVSATIIVCSSGNDAADRELAARRANRLKAELAASYVDVSRISTRTCQAGAGDGGEDAQTIAIALSRGG